MTNQEINGRILNQLWRMGESVFEPLFRMVEEAEEPECELCGGTGEYTLGHSDSDWGEPVKCECAK